MRRAAPPRIGVLALATAAAACGPGIWSEAPPPPPVVSICILDVSGSMRRALSRAAQDVCIDAIRTAPPGEVIVRILDAAAARNEDEWVRLGIPALSSCANPFAPACREEERAGRVALDSARAAAIQRVRRVELRPGGRTDLLGALAAASLTFAAGPKDAERRLLLVSDLDSNVHRPGNGHEDGGVPIRLPGVDVTAVVQCSADPAADRRLQDRFRALVTAAGARSVTIVPLSPSTP